MLITGKVSKAKRMISHLSSTATIDRLIIYSTYRVSNTHWVWTECQNINFCSICTMGIFGSEKRINKEEWNSILRTKWSNLGLIFRQKLLKYWKNDIYTCKKQYLKILKFWIFFPFFSVFCPFWAILKLKI